MVRKLERKLQGAEGIDVVVTSSKQHFRECARNFFQGPHENLLVWGGDGTAHDAINAVYPALELTPPNVRKSIGFLRGGTGNGIQDSYEVPFRLGAQLATYAHSTRKGYTIDVDLLRVDDGQNVRYGQLAGLGFDAEVLLKRERAARPRADSANAARSGVVRYLSAGLSLFFSGSLAGNRHTWDMHLSEGKYSFRGPRVNAEFPINRLQMQRSPLMVEIGTRPFYGKMFRVCPDVVCNDGSMDVYLYDFSSRREVLRNAYSIWTGNHSRINRTLSRARKPVIERYEVTGSQFYSSSPFYYHIDGELLHAGSRWPDGQYGIKVDIMPAALSFMVPVQFYHIFHPFSENPNFARMQLDSGASAGVEAGQTQSHEGMKPQEIQ